MRECDQFPGSPTYDGSGILRHRYSLQEVHTGWIAHFESGDVRYPSTVEPPKIEGVVVSSEVSERDIGVPRWFIHGWRSHTKLDVLNYEKDSVYYDADTNETYQVQPPQIGPGQWSVVLHTVVSNPRDGCCSVARFRREKCFHEYRDPGQEDLDYLAAMWREQLKRPVYFAEGDIAPPRLIEERTRERLAQIADSKQRARAETRLRIQSAFKDSRHRLFDMPRSGYSVATGNAMPTGKNVR